MQRERSFVEPNFVETFKPPQVQIMTASSPGNTMIGSPGHKMSERLEEKVAILQVRHIIFCKYLIHQFSKNSNGEEISYRIQ